MVDRDFLQLLGVESSGIFFAVELSHMKGCGSRSWTEQDLDAESSGVIARLLCVFKEANDNLSKIAQLAGISQNFLPIQRQRAGDDRRKPQDVQHGVQVRFGCEVESGSHPAAHAVNGQVRGVVHVDEVTHVYLVVRSGNGKIVVYLLQQSVAHFRPNISLLFYGNPIFLRNNAICHRLRQIVQLLQRLCQSQMGVVEHVEPHVVVNIRDPRQVECVLLFVVQLVLQEFPTFGELQECLALVQLDPAQSLVIILTRFEPCPSLDDLLVS
mmetsp:Transcript_56610/g.120193  ORF Transcript_56610/g.120193 Transcript_56610/m.120193 type:complete len:269 (-) Transcript_56610:3996-4802(-)